MSEIAVEKISRVDSSVDTASVRPLNVLAAGFLSLWVAVRPRWSGEKWQRISIWRAAVVGVVHLLTIPFWIVTLGAALNLWSNSMLRNGITGEWNKKPGTTVVEQLRTTIAGQWRDVWEDFVGIFGTGVYTVTTNIAGAVLMVLLLLGLGFFVLIPFAVRPGRNRACLKHVARATLLGTGFVHVLLGSLTAAYAMMIVLDIPPEGPRLYVVLGVLGAGMLWTIQAMIRAVRVEYRKPSDMPKALSPRCDVCGYDLHMADMAGKCPECGKPVAESLGAEFRAPSAWEKSPGFRVMLKQAREVVRRPRELFARMVTRSGQLEAQRWMLIWLMVAGFAAFWTVPLLTLQLKYGWVAPGAPMWATDAGHFITWNWDLLLTILAGGLTLGILWAIFGMMMVGVETVGVVAVAYFRKNYVPLASAAKVTCYASPLMIVWAVAGALHVVLVIMAYQQGWFRVHPMAEQIGIVGSTAIAHIGGLLWFEWTVYRGLRGIQYASH